MRSKRLHAYFEPLDSEDDFVGSPRTDFALDSKLETLPRELIQNTYDAREDGEKPKIRFYFECLDGSDLDAFKNAIDWDTLEPHLEAVAEDDEKLGVQKVLDRIEEGELYVLGVVDVNAVGLDGDDASRGTKYASLVKDFADSTKKEGGGIHGVGASVLWAFSGPKLVLFHSQPKDESEPKMVGRLDLPDHERNDPPDYEPNGQEFEGGGWLGVETEEYDRPVAMNDIPGGLAETLRIDRPDANGTTALVVGFKEPTRATRDPEEIVDGLYEAAARYYWPLIVDDGIEVTVQGPADGSPRKVKPETVDRAKPYVKGYESWESPDEDFGDPGTVAVDTLKFEVPPTESEPAKTGELVLVVRIPDDDDLDKYRNKVAMFRGARHVVKYRNYGSVSRTTGRDFHALLLAGGAKHEEGLTATDLPDEDDQAIESFFRDAEPEAHSTWEQPTQKLANTYEDDNPSQRIVSFLKTDVKQKLQQMLADAETSEDERVDTLGSEFPFFEDDRGHSGKKRRKRGGGGSSPFAVARLDSWFDGSHRYEGEFELDSPPSEAWSVTVSIEEVDGSNKTIDQIDVADGSSPDGKDPSVNDGEITFKFPPHVANPSFELASEKIGDQILAGRTRLDFEYDLGGGSA